jgi:hypothetical protein
MHLSIKSHIAQLFLRSGRAGAVGFSLLCLLVGVLRPVSAATLTLAWVDSSTNESGFTIQRKAGSAGTFGQLATVAAGATGYVDSTVTAGTTYCYRVSAYNSAGSSAYSNEACATPASATLYSVTVAKAGTGAGTVASSPAALNCGSTCKASVASGTSLALSATPAAGSTFTGWSGACIGSGTCALVVDAAKTLTATFSLNSSTTSTGSAPSTATITVTKNGNGSGVIASSPSGINCSTTCSASFPSGSSITLAAVSTTRSTFAGWSGACTGSGVCILTLDGSKTVTATFTRSRWRQAMP